MQYTILLKLKREVPESDADELDFVNNQIQKVKKEMFYIEY